MAASDSDDERVLSDQDKALLNSHRVCLCEELDVYEILVSLESYEVIDGKKRDEIKSKATRCERAECLINILSRCSSKHYCIFRDSLKQCYPHLHNLLLPDEEKSQEYKPMSEERKEKITHCSKDISELLSVDYIAGYLHQENVLSNRMKEQLGTCKTEREKAAMFTECIVTRGDSAYDTFLNSLKLHNDPKNNHLKLWEIIKEEVILEEERQKLVGTKSFQEYCQRRKKYMKQKASNIKRHKLYPNLKMTSQVEGDSATVIEIEPKDMFKTFASNIENKNENNNPKRIILKGPAGIGKTTLIEKIELDWLKGNLWPDTFVAIFPIKLRDHLQTGKDAGSRNLCSLMLDFYGPPIDGETKKQEIMDSICNNESKILIIFDGLDEVKEVTRKFDTKPAGVNNVLVEVSFESLVYSVGSKDLLPGAYVILTTRPLALKPENILSGACIDVEGFDQKKITKYTKQYASLHYKNDTRQKKFIKDVDKIKERQPVAESLCYYPLFCHYICELVAPGIVTGQEQATFTRVLIEILVQFTKRSSTTYNRSNNSAEQQLQSKRLCKVAKMGMSNESLVFTEKSLIELGINEPEVFRDMGLWKENLQYLEDEDDEGDKDGKSDDSDNADGHASEDEDSCGTSSNEDKSADSSEDDDDYNSFRFSEVGPLFRRSIKTYEFIHTIFQEFWAACAFAVDTERDTGKWIKEVKNVIGGHQYDMVLTFLIGLLMDEYCQSFVKGIENVPDVTNEMQIYQMRANEIYSWVLNMLFEERKHIEKSTKRLMLLTLYQESQQCPPKNHWQYICSQGIFILYQVRLNPKELSAVQYFMEQVGNKIPVTKMIFEKNLLSSKNADFISKIVANAPQLKSLKVPNNELGKEGLKKICKTIKGSKCLEKLELCSNKLKDDIDSLVETIHTLPKLQYLGLASNGITEEGAKKIVSALEMARNNQQLCQFKQLDIAYNHIVEGATMDELEQRLKKLNIIVLRMGMHHHKPTPEKNGTERQLTTQRSTFSILEDYAWQNGIFFMNKQKLNSEEMSKVEECMKTYAITKVKLEKMSVESNVDISDFISTIVKSASNLESLKLPDNQISSKGLKKICDKLKDSSTLKILEMRTNHFMDDIDPLLDIMHTLSSLQYLGLNSTGMTDEGAKKFVKAIETAKKNKQLESLTKIDIAYNHVVEKSTLDLFAGLWEKFGILVLKMGMNRRINDVK